MSKVLFWLLKLSIFLIRVFSLKNADLLEPKLLIGMHVSGEAEVQQSICFLNGQKFGYWGLSETWETSSTSSLSLTKASLSFQENFCEEMCFSPSVKKNILLIKQVFVTTQYPEQKEQLAGKTPLSASAGACFVFAIQGICTGAAAMEPQWSWAIMLGGVQELQHCTAEPRAASVPPWALVLPHPFYTSKQELLKGDKLSKGSCLPCSLFLPFHSPQKHKHISCAPAAGGTGLLKKACKEVVLCPLKQCLLIAQILKLTLFVHGRSIFL